MNSVPLISKDRKSAGSMLGEEERRSRQGIAPDLMLLAVLLVAANTHLFTSEFSTRFIFLPEAVKAGEVWRLITFPFVHLTWYHFFLDAGAFFLLYKDMITEKVHVKLAVLIICGVFSLATSVIAYPALDTQGLCGLSGIAHGLMAASALDMMRGKRHFIMGIALFAVVVSKSIFEILSGHVLFEFMHLGLCGFPVAASHAGGVLGGIVANSVLIRPLKRNDQGVN